MEKQYCKVGSVTPIAATANPTNVLEYQYKNFLDLANSIKYANTQLGDFFEQKAKKIKKCLEKMA